MQGGKSKPYSYFFSVLSPYYIKTYASFAPPLLWGFLDFALQFSLEAIKLVMLTIHPMNHPCDLGREGCVLPTFGEGR